jgi:probable F420-dependent oxidoreductase
MRLGLTFPFASVPLRDHEPLLRRAQELGYQDLWSAETNGADGFTPLALAAAWTTEPRLLTGVVNPYTRGPAVLAQHCAALADASGGRFALGIGASSNRIVEHWNGVAFEKPLSRVRQAVEELRPVLSGGRGPGGFKLETPPAHPVPIFIAALRDKMLQLGGSHGDGTFANFLPLSGAPHVVAQVRAGEAAAGREAGASEVACRFFCIPQPEEEALGLAKFMFAAYGTVPVYAKFFGALGWEESLAPVIAAWQGGDRKQAVELVPEDLVREIFLFGSPEAIHDRLAAFEAAGIQTATLMPICPPERIGDVLEALAPR